MRGGRKSAVQQVHEDVDIRETDDAKAYRFAVELPGFEKDEIHADVQDGYLTVSAEKGLDKGEENKKDRIISFRKGRWCTIIVEFYHDRSQSCHDSAKGGGNVI